MKADYLEAERIKQTQMVRDKNPIFYGAEGGGNFLGAKRDFVLTEGYKNLYEPIREDAIMYFSENKISWWGGSKPTGHVLSSQIACINHLFPIRNDKSSVLDLIKNISSDFVDVLEIETDTSMKGYIQFEAVSQEDHLNEGLPTRGSNCTSIDAMIFAQHKDGSKWLIPIEWKYTENYKDENKATEGLNQDPENCKGEVRKRRYTDLINNSRQLKSGDHSCYYFEPFYQLMRQTLWAEQMILKKEKETIKADNYIHLHIIPKENGDLLEKIYPCSGLKMETTWRAHLNRQDRYMILTPEKFLSVQGIRRNHGLFEYLSQRYW